MCELSVFNCEMWRKEPFPVNFLIFRRATEGLEGFLREEMSAVRFRKRDQLALLSMSQLGGRG